LVSCRGCLLEEIWIAMPKEDSLTDRNFAVRLMEHLVVPTFVLEPKGTIIIWNRACERLTGVAASEVLGRKEHWRAFYDAHVHVWRTSFCKARRLSCSMRR